MTDEKNDPEGSGRPGDPLSESDRVGYGCPPRHTRFKPGQSGNPRGRPRRVRTLRADCEKVLREHITIREGERLKRVTKAEALARTNVNRAINGDSKSVRAVLQMMQTGEPESQVEPDQAVTGDDEAILENFIARHRVDIAPTEGQIDQKPDEPSKVSNVTKVKPREP